MKAKNLMLVGSLFLIFNLVFIAPAWAEDSAGTTQEESLNDEEVVSVEEAVYENIITPDSFLYTFKIFIEDVQVFFTFDEQKRAELLTKLAYERLQEADLMLEKGELELVERLIRDYEEKIIEVDKNLGIIEEIDEDFEDESEVGVVEDTYELDENEVPEEDNEEFVQLKGKNIAALIKVLDKVPDHVKPVIERNIQKAMTKQERHLAKMQEEIGQDGLDNSEMVEGEDTITDEETSSETTMETMSVDNKNINELENKKAKKDSKEKDNNGRGNGIDKDDKQKEHRGPANNNGRGNAANR